MTNEQVDAELTRHAALLQKAEREGWTLLPIPLEEKQWRLRWAQFEADMDASNQRIREARHAKAS